MGLRRIERDAVKWRTSYYRSWPLRFAISSNYWKTQDGGTSEPRATIESFETRTVELGADVRPGTYRAVLRQTGIKEPEE
jgi:hypothetical protein